ncbi:MAG: glycosyltransferase, partial [Nitrososphaeraceae archaeon]
MNFARPTIDKEPPKVSIIIAARNEEKYISKCLDSLLQQDYPNFEIIVIDDSSSDSTCEILQKYQIKNCDKIVVINAGLSPNEWTGKNWACYQGYLKSRGEAFLFTDADTLCSSQTLSLAVGNLNKEKLDALTLRPRIVSESRWAKMMLPVLWSFSHIKYSSLRVNDHNAKKCGYFFGCFYLIT